MRRSLDLYEHRPVDDLALPEAVVRALIASPHITISPSMRPDCWTLRARQYIGTLHAEDLEIRIHPKVPVGNVLFLLAYAKDQQGWRDILTTMEASLDLVTAVAMGLIRLASNALQRGVLQGYKEIEDGLQVLRGRIRAGDQLTQHFGLPLPLEVRFDEFTVDIPENQILRSALSHVVMMPNFPGTAKVQARHLVGLLEGASFLPARQPAPTIRFNRLNDRYRGAITLAKLILEARSLMFTQGTTSTSGFLFDMNKVFEDFVSAALSAHFETSAYALREQRWQPLDRDEKIWLRPDLTWWLGDRCAGVADAKYKSVAIYEIPNADVYQLLAYCIANGLSNGHLIYASGNEQPALHSILRSDIAIRAHVLDLAASPIDLLRRVGALYSELTGLVESAAAHPLHGAA